jgi:DMSO/TMAO reductase YedYZ molybdopterin-dependent catalytic subunit
MAETNAGRSIHGAPEHARKQAANPVLTIEGLVARTCQLKPDQIAALPHRRFLDLEISRDETFLPETDWSGVMLDDLLSLAEPLENANWVRVSAGPYAYVVPREQFAATLLCDRLGADSIPLEKGGPWRLVNPNAGYNMSVKWVDRLTLSEDEPDNSALRIAEARQRARDAKQARSVDWPAGLSNLRPLEGEN